MYFLQWYSWDVSYKHQLGLPMSEKKHKKAIILMHSTVLAISYKLRIKIKYYDHESLKTPGEQYKCEVYKMMKFYSSFSISITIKARFHLSFSLNGRDVEVYSCSCSYSCYLQRIQHFAKWLWYAANADMVEMTSQRKL